MYQILSIKGWLGNSFDEVCMAAMSIEVLGAVVKQFLCLEVPIISPLALVVKLREIVIIKAASQVASVQIGLGWVA